MPELRKVAIITGASLGIGAGPVAVLEAQRRFRPPPRRGAVRRHKPAAAVITHASHDQATTHHAGDEHAAYGSSTRPSAVSARTVSRQHESPNHQTRSCTCPSPTSASTPQAPTRYVEPGSNSLLGELRGQAHGGTFRGLFESSTRRCTSIRTRLSCAVPSTSRRLSSRTRTSRPDARQTQQQRHVRRPLPATRGFERSPSKHDPRDEQQHAKNVKEERDVIHRRNPPRERSRWTDRPNSGTRAYGALTVARGHACESRKQHEQRPLQLDVPQHLRALAFEHTRFHPVKRPPDTNPDARLRSFKSTAIRATPDDRRFGRRRCLVKRCTSRLSGGAQDQARSFP